MTTYNDAHDIATDLHDWIEDGQITDRDELMNAMHETVDGCLRVIYTHLAKEAVSEHGTEAYTDRFGEEGLTKGGDINWSAIAFCIVEDLAWEALEGMGIDPNDPFKCPECELSYAHAEHAEECCADDE